MERRNSEQTREIAGNAVQLRRQALLDEQAGNYAHAIECCLALLQGNTETPGSVETHLARLYRLTQDYPKAADYYQKAIVAQPRNAMLYFHLGTLLLEVKYYDEGLHFLEKSFALDPSQPQLCLILSSLYLQNCQLGKARQVMAQACRLMPENPLLKFKLETLFLPILSSTQEAVAFRQTLHRLISQPAQLAPLDFIQASLQPSQLLAYHGIDDKALRSAYGDFVAHHLKTSNPMQSPGFLPAKKGQPFVGFHVPQDYVLFHRAMGALLDNLDRRRIGFAVLCSDKAQAYLSRRLRPDTDFVVIPGNPEQAAAQIQRHGFDVLYYFEVGTTAENYLLPFFKPAPVQCVSSWGYPETTGIPGMDFFISSALIEPEDAAAKYRENLILMKNLPIVFSKPQLPENSKPRSAFDLPDNRTLYCCPQNLFKFHPDFDPILAEILERDPQGLLVIFTSRYTGQDAYLKNRLRQRINDIDQRLLILPRLDREDYLNVLACCNVVLDTPHFGGGITTLEAFSVGVPVVTLPGALMRSRMALACYRKMGLTGAVADSARQYVELAVHLGTSSQAHRAFSNQIQAWNACLYDDSSAARELEDILIEIAGLSHP